ncbi:hypothetical protein Tco_0954578 [Tanacetum coccineum]|uniref:Uncharacterized protein n=1 Tax=Tanacetum coccineum TaxID=301880 RepID=A0ABQ5E4T6_9ASTR
MTFITFQDLCLRQELLEYMDVYDNDASESLQPSWGKTYTLMLSAQLPVGNYDGEMTSKYFIEYTRIEVQQFHDTLIQHLESVKKSIDERALHKRDSGTTFEKQDECNSSGNDTDTDDTNIKPVYDEEPMADVQLTAEYNVVAKEQQHAKQLDLINEEKVYQDAEQCHDKRHFLAKLTKNKTTKLSHQSLESENTHLKNTVAQFQQKFSKLEAHCINLELQLQNNVFKSGQHGQFLKAKSNEAKVQNDIDVIETINIELQHKVAKLLKKNEHLKA